MPIFYDLEGGVRHDDDDDTETPDPVQAQIPSHPGIKYPVRGIPPSDLVPGHNGNSIGPGIEQNMQRTINRVQNTLGKLQFAGQQNT